MSKNVLSTDFSEILSKVSFLELAVKIKFYPFFELDRQIMMYSNRLENTYDFQQRDFLRRSEERRVGKEC